MTSARGSAHKEEWEKVVVRFGSEVVKGYLEMHSWSTLEELLVNAPDAPPKSLRIRKLESDAIEELPIEEAKAIFYVKEFEGDSEHKDLQFYTHAPFVHGVWIRVEFIDGEVMEGIVQNTLHFLVDPGFFIRPTDPGSNNKLVYVLKSWLKDYRVLGLRNL